MNKLHAKSIMPLFNVQGHCLAKLKLLVLLSNKDLSLTVDVPFAFFMISMPHRILHLAAVKSG